MRSLIVGGTFDTNGGKSSYIVEQLREELDWPCINGGNLTALDIDFSQLDVLVWMPNISNDEDKILPAIKVKNPHLLLVSSKRVIEKHYSDFETVSRLLKSHSNLGIIITKDGDYQFNIMDPLGNSWSCGNSVRSLARQLGARISLLRSMTRVASKPAKILTQKESESFWATELGNPDFDAFVEIVREYGDEFSKFVNAVNPERFLGNASARTTDRITRCCHGFPAYNAGDVYLVSRRNVDKTTLSSQDFVPVLANEDTVYYCGSTKPSVDSPIQIRLFNHYPNVRYILHGHVYIKGSLFTSQKIPCGHIEEFDEIINLVPNKNQSNFSVNLLGHGCLILAEDLNYLKSMMHELTARPFPEGQFRFL